MDYELLHITFMNLKCKFQVNVRGHFGSWNKDVALQLGRIALRYLFETMTRWRSLKSNFMYNCI